MLNPVLRREIQTSLRNWKVYAAIVFYVVALAAVAAVVFWTEIYNSYDFSFDPAAINALYALMAVMQLFLIIVIVPAITGGSISGERERQTFDLLLVSKMKPVSIITGKLLASIGIVLIMIIASMPVFALAIQFGGAKVLDVVLLMLYFVATAVCLGSVSILLSSVIKRSAVSMVVVYIVCAFLIVGTVILYMLFSDYYWMMNRVYPPVVLYWITMITNPLMSVFAVIDSQINIGLSEIFALGYSYGKDISLISIFGGHIAFMAVVSAASIFISSKAINPVRKRLFKG